MFEAFKIGVVITVTDEISGPVNKITKDLLKQGLALQMFGNTLMNYGKTGLNAMRSVVAAASDYNHQLNIMNMAGMTQKEIAESIAAAWQTTKNITTTTATGNLETILDLRNVFGRTDEAIQYLPEIAKIATVLSSSSAAAVHGTNANDIAFAVAKAMDMRGAVFSPAVFNQQAEMMAKVIIATQGRVTPEGYRLLFKYGRQAIPGLSNEFLYEELPTFMLEMLGARGGGGGSHGGFGTSLAAFNRLFVQGVMSKSALAGLQSIGLVSSNVGLKTTTTGTMLLPGEHVKDVELAASDPFQYVQKVLLPAIFAKYGTDLSKEQLSVVIASLLKGASSTALFAVNQFAIKGLQVARDQALIQKTMGVSAAFASAMSNDPKVVNQALADQWINLKAAFGMAVIPVIIPAMIKLTKALTDFADFIRAHQGMAKFIIVLIGALSGLAVVFGGLAVVAGSILLLASALGGGIVAATILAVATAVGVLSAEFYAFGQNLDALIKEIKGFFGGFGFHPSNLAYVGFGSPTPHESSIGQNPNTAAQAHGTGGSSVGHVFLDKHKVGKVVFGNGFDSQHYLDQLSHIGSFNIAASPTVPSTPAGP